METEIIASVISLGVGGVLGLVIFFMYRKDRKDTESRWAGLAEELVDCRKDENVTRLELAKAVTELTILLRKSNGRT